MLLVELLFNGTDIAFTLNQDRIKSSGTQFEKDILAAWDNLNTFTGVVGITKSVVEGALKYSCKIESFGKIVYTTATSTPQKLKDLSSSLYNLLVKLGTKAKFTGSEFLRTLVLKAYLEAQIANFTPKIADNILPAIKQGDNLVYTLKIKGIETELAAGKAISGADGSSVVLTDLKWYNKAQNGEIEKVIHDISQIDYVSQAGKQAKGSIQAVLTKNGEVFFTVANANQGKSLYETFKPLNKIDKFQGVRFKDETGVNGALKNTKILAETDLGEKPGEFILRYHSASNTLNFPSAHLNDAPKWMTDLPISFDSRGYPLAKYVMLRGMINLDIPYGSLKYINLQWIQNAETVCLITQLMKKYKKLSEIGNDALKSEIVKYVEHPLEVSGHKIISAKITGDQVSDITTTFTAREALLEYPDLKGLDETMLNKYGLTMDSELIVNFNILLELAPIE
jgi:hypothetical protein